MNASFVWLMRRSPQIMAVAALLFYVGSIVIAFNAASTFSDMIGETRPITHQVSALLIAFGTPLLPATLMLFGAALLWRVDQWLDRQAGTYHA